MTLVELVNSACRRTNKDSTNSTVKTRFIDHVNFARKKAWHKFNWPWKQKCWYFTVSDQIVAGTASVANGLRTVTLSSASVGAAQIGWYFQVYGISPAPFYRVINVSGQTLTLDPAYQGATNSTASFYLRGFDWTVPSEMIGMPTLTEFGTTPITLHSMFSRPTLIPDTRGQPTWGYIWSDDPIGTTYTTGTVTSTAGNRTWTGVGTLWLSGTNAPRPGDSMDVTVGSTTYKHIVQSIQSETSLVTYQYAQVGVAASAYTSINQFARYVRLSATPDNPYVMAMYGVRRCYDLAHDNDIDELLRDHDDCILEGVEAYEMASSPDDREDPKYNRFLRTMAEKIGATNRDFAVVEPAPISLPYGAYRA